MSRTQTRKKKKRQQHQKGGDEQVWEKSEGGSKRACLWSRGMGQRTKLKETQDAPKKKKTNHCSSCEARGGLPHEKEGGRRSPWSARGSEASPLKSGKYFTESPLVRGGSQPKTGRSPSGGNHPKGPAEVEEWGAPVRGQTGISNLAGG